MKIKDPMTGEERDKTVTSMTPPAEELATDPIQTAGDYTRRVQERRANLEAAKRQRKPLGGAPPIPEGKLSPLVDAAKKAGMPRPFFESNQPPPNVPPEEWRPPPQPPQQQRQAPPPPPQGVGSAYAVNRAMARGEVDKPVPLSRAREFEENQRVMQEHVPQEEAAPPQEETNSAKERLKDVEKEIAEGNRLSPEDVGPLFNVDAIRQIRQPLFDEEKKSLIEERLAPLDISDLISSREITQEVPIIPGKLTLEFRTFSEKEYLYCMEYLYEHSTTNSSAQYVEELFNTLKITASVIAVNGGRIPDHRDNIGEPGEKVNPEKFKKKLDIILGFPTIIIAEMGVEFTWFNDRVSKLLSLENFKKWLETPVGWARANMLYDLARQPPEPGSPLESIFLVLTKRKQEQEFLKTRVLVEVALAPHVKESSLSDVYKDYMDAMFPYLSKEKTDRNQDMKTALKNWVGQRALKVRPLWQMKQPQKQFQSALTKGRARAEKANEMRKKGIIRSVG